MSDKAVGNCFVGDGIKAILPLLLRRFISDL
jgi:hypothetical protein